MWHFMKVGFEQWLQRSIAALASDNAVTLSEYIWLLI